MEQAASLKLSTRVPKGRGISDLSSPKPFSVVVMDDGV